MTPEFIVTEYQNIRLIQFPHFIESGLKAHGITTRQGGVSEGALSSLNMGRRTLDSPEHIIENQRRVAEALGVSPGSFVFSDQVHGVRIQAVNPGNRAQPVLETDALMTDASEITLSTLYADCMPILLYDPVRQVIGMAHAGWRGTAQAIGEKLVVSMAAHYGSKPGDMLGALGPAIGACCFEVGEEVVSAFKALDALSEDALWLYSSGGKPHVNLAAINRILLIEAGLRSDAVKTASLCTHCNPDLLYSHRRDQGNTGRMAALMAL